MTKSEKIVLSSSRDIPFNKLVLSQANVRRVKAGVSIEELAEDIARRTLLTSITVRHVVDADGTETGMFEIPAGGRRFRALELLVRQKRLNKTAPVPCIVREDGTPEEDSLAENVQRAPLHPLDQFRAFLALREKGQSEEKIAAAFFVSVAVVKQRLKLASVSPKLLDVYADDGMTLDQLMAFTVNGDHERQEQVFEQLAQSYSKEPYAIRRMLTEGAVRACDKRAQFVELAAYVEAGGTILRDLFQTDDGGWLQDTGLLDMLVAEKLCEDAEPIRAEGWKWIDVAPDFPYGHTYGLRRLRGDTVPLTDEEQAARDALQSELDELEQQYAEANELPDAVDERLGEIETALAGFDERPMVYEADEMARAGAFVSIDGAGHLRIERGYVRPEDEAPIEPEVASEGDADAGESVAALGNGPVDAGDVEPAEPDEDDGLTPIAERLMTELTAHRTLALRQALGDDPEIAFLAALHALCLKLFYHYAQDTCLDLDIKSVGFGAQAPGLADSVLASEVDNRHQEWASDLPKQPEDLWDALRRLDLDSRQALFAHCVAQSVNAIHEAYYRRPRALAHADRLAETLDLDMVAAGWEPTVDTWLGRVTKARILATVREAKGDEAAERIAHLKKGEMAEKAQELLAGSGWLPEVLRTAGRGTGIILDDGGEASEAIGTENGLEANPDDEHAIAAE
ncbi:ParB/RepB/Spo0J family partition protein [Pararhizobium mangrovi]|uniref:ParB/RepB/Spo0J family partition protein n=1 Tax=Pararhizobium mangrovi TaxID=2590452 RepID=A0A506U771_9HYPH|nr:ParB/RepB/Spo0J family partition protein [Pararhizobium mangrovi]TPW27737.1 ParB/RepB/Spo0J family partition protein [Pararhizobium mangrovi]